MYTKIKRKRKIYHIKKILFLPIIFSIYAANRETNITIAYNVSLTKNTDIINNEEEKIKTEENPQKEKVPNSKKPKIIPTASVEYIKSVKLTTKDIVRTLIEENFTDEEILTFFFEDYTQEKREAVLINDKKNEKSNIYFSTPDDEEQKSIDRVLKKIKDKLENEKSKNIEKKGKQKQLTYPSLNYIKETKLTTKKLILNLMKKNINEERILRYYFNMSEEKLGEIISNDRKAIICKNDIVEASKKEQQTINQIIQKIQKEEIHYLNKKIPLPTNNKKNIVVLNAGHGGEDSGAVAKIEENQIVKEKNLNSLVIHYLTKSLLAQGFEVYNTYDESKLEEKNPAYHPIFKNRPPLRGPGKACRIVDAAHRIIKGIFEKIKNKVHTKNNKPKVISICIHHNSCSNNNAFGFIPYYEDSNNTSNKFTAQSKKLASIFYKYGTGITPDEHGQNCGEIKKENWAVCHFGGNNEKNIKEFNDQAAVLLEREFMSNKTQLKKLLQKHYLKKTAENFTKAICEYFGKQYIETKESKKIEKFEQKIEKIKKKSKLEQNSN